MTIRGRALLIVGSALALLIAIQYSGLRYAFSRALTTVEVRGTESDVTQAVNQLNDDVATMNAIAADYAAWDDAYAYMAARDARFTTSGLTVETLQRLRLDLVMMVDPQSRPVLVMSPTQGAARDAVASELLQYLKPGTPLTTFAGTHDSHHGFLRVTGDPVAVSVRPIVTSENAGPIRGTMLMARRLTGAEIASLSETSKLDLTLLPAPSGDAVKAAGGVAVTPISPERIRGEATVLDVFNQPALTLRVEAGRPFKQEGERLLRYVAASLIGSIVVVALIVMGMLDVLILHRLTSVSSDVTRIARSGDLSRRLNDGGGDELSTVSRAIDGLLDSVRLNRDALEASEQRYRSVVEHVSDVVFQVDGEGRWQFLNAAWPRLSGWSVEESLRHPMSDFIHPEDWALHARHNCLLTAGDAETHVSVRLMTRTGELRWVSVKASMLRDANDDPVGAAGTIEDVSERRQIEGERERAQQEALEAARLKSEFVANMSHEIRTPMNGVMGMLRILQDTPLTAEQHESVDTALSCAEGLLGILNDVLDLSKIEAGKLTINPEPVGLCELLEDVLDMFGSIVGSRDVDLLLTIDPQVPGRVVCDPIRLRQILVNLVGNAVKFTERGHVHVRVRAESADAGAPLLFSVDDSGIGVPAEKLNAIFESFTQADAAATRKFGGTGLGLTITRRLLGMMGGTIWVESQPGVGSTFNFRVPFQAAESAATPVLQERVLLVDRPGIRRDTYAANLRVLGVAVTEADSARIAEVLVSFATEGPPPAVVVLRPSRTDEGGAEVQALAATAKRRVLVVTDRESSRTGRFAQQGVVVLSQPVRREQWVRAFGGGTATVRPASVEQAQFTGRVLVAEDNAVNRRVAIAMLEKRGCVVDAATNGREAVALAVARPYDLVLMDCHMPELDGYEATGQIRRLLGERRLPIVALTSDAMADAKARCLAAGMDGYLSKPFKNEWLDDVLQKYLRPTTETEPPAAATAALATADSSPELPPIDLALLRERLDNDDELIAELAGMFAEDGRRLVDECAGADSSESGTRAAHTLKGAAANLCAAPLASAAAHVEHAFKAGDLAAAQKGSLRLRQELDRLRPCLDAIASRTYVSGVEQEARA